MRAIVLRFARRDGQNNRFRFYRLADQWLAVDRPLCELEPFAGEGRNTPASLSSSRRENAVVGPGRLIFEEEAWVGNAKRRVSCRYQGSVYEIQIDGIGTFSVSGDGSEIVLSASVPSVKHGVLVEAALGPALILALAIRGVFCFHASAVSVGGGSVMFVGDSGAGKSTLAKALEDTDAGIIRITDDISPLRCVSEQARLLPYFPQLKLAAPEQWAGSGASPVSAIYDLQRAAPDRVGAPPVFRERLSAMDSFKSIVGHSVASCLFPSELKSRHTRQMAELIRLVPMYRLTYPSGMEHIDAVRAYLLARHS